MTANIEDLIRRIAANEAERTVREHERRFHPQAVSDLGRDTSALVTQCPVVGRTGHQCSKPRGHGQRHRYQGVFTPPTPPPPRNWIEQEAFTLGRYSMTVGSPVKVPSFGRGHTTGWVIRRIERRVDATGRDLDKINVEVWKPGEHVRTVKADRVVYVRPTSKAGREAIALAGR